MLFGEGRRGGEKVWKWVAVFVLREREKSSRRGPEGWWFMT